MSRVKRPMPYGLIVFTAAYAMAVGLVAWGCGSSGGVPTPTPSATPTGSPTATPTSTPTPSGTPTASPTATPTPTPTPTNGPCPPISCASDGECSDGLYCNGDETCNGLTQSCECTDPPCNPDTEECDEATDDCVPIGDPGCESDQDCDADEYCNENSGDCLRDFTASCVPGAGVCNIANSSPGCENPQCCEAVCTQNPACCLVQWTQECADRALTSSTCLANP